MQACASPRACALPRPTLQRQGLLWVWAGGGGALAALEAAATPPVLAAELDASAEGVPTRASDGRKATMRSYYYRELCAPISHTGTCCSCLSSCVLLGSAVGHLAFMQTECLASCRPRGWGASWPLLGAMLDHINRLCCRTQAVRMGHPRGEPDRPFPPALQPPHCPGQQVCLRAGHDCLHLRCLLLFIQQWAVMHSHY